MEHWTPKWIWTNDVNLGHGQGAESSCGPMWWLTEVVLRGSRRDTKGSLWHQGQDREKKARTAWASGAIRRRQWREFCFPFGQGGVQGHSSVLLSAVLGCRSSCHSWALSHHSRKESPISTSSVIQCCHPWVPNDMVHWMLQESKQVSRK